MEVLLLVEEQAARLQVADDVAIGILDPAALVVGGLGCEGAFGGDGVDELRALAFHKAGLLGQQNVEVDLAEGRGLVDDARAGIGRDEVRRDNPPGDVLRAADLSWPCFWPSVEDSSRTARRIACRRGRCRGMSVDFELEFQPSFPRVVRRAPTQSKNSHGLLHRRLQRRDCIPAPDGPRRIGCSAGSKGRGPDEQTLAKRLPVVTEQRESHEDARDRPLRGSPVRPRR